MLRAAQGTDHFKRLIVGYSQSEVKLIPGTGPGPVERRGQRSIAGGQIEVVHGLRDVEVRVRVEAVDELAAAVTQIALYFEITEKSNPKASLSRRRRPNFFRMDVVAHVRDVSDHAGYCQSPAGGLPP